MFGFDLAALPLAFAAPLALLALAGLPLLWLLLRMTPPRPERVVFPPLGIVADLIPRRQTPARTPWWLLLLRLLVALLIIAAVAWPAWNPLPAAPGEGPTLLIVDNDATAAHDWDRRMETAQDVLAAAARSGKTVAIVGLADTPETVQPADAARAVEKLRALQPVSYLASRERHVPALREFLAAHPQADIVWIAGRAALATEGEGQDNAANGSRFADELETMREDRQLAVHVNEAPAMLALAGSSNTAQGLEVRVIRPVAHSTVANGRDTGNLRALDFRGLPLGEAVFSFPPGELETTAVFDLPVEIRNEVARVDVIGESSAMAVTLMDERHKRRRVGIVAASGADTANQPLLAPTFYIRRALEPYAELREPQGATPDAIAKLIDEHASAIILADVGAIDQETAQKLDAFVRAGGVLVRFAGPRLTSQMTAERSGMPDPLLPVRPRMGERTIGGALSWDTPRTLAPFPEHSPFRGLSVPEEITVTRQVLAEPDGELMRRTWAALTDGTPVVTAARQGEGMIVLFHVTADTTWSSLPLSGAFVEMLQRIVGMGSNPEINTDMGADADTVAVATPETASPRITLDGFGIARRPPPTARPVARDFASRASADHPAGFYGAGEQPLAVNTLISGDRLVLADLSAVASSITPLSAPRSIDLRPPLLVLALVLFLIDTLVSALMGGRLRFRARRAVVPVVVLAGALGAGNILLPEAVQAQGAVSTAGQGVPPAMQAALQTRLAYVMTGDAQIDETSRAGLAGLSRELSYRTSFEPAEPDGVDPASDELAFYPLIYWPISATAPRPSQEALRRIDAYMKAGGTVVFDTRDAWSVVGQAGGGPSPETARLREMLAGIEVPELEPVPADHVLTKTFFLVDHFPGRYATGETWVAALPPAIPGEPAPARGGDNVSPIIITSNDLAAAWALDDFGNPMHPLSGSDPDQYEMANRGGINMVMYVLTGSYKADQVHIPALLDRLGQ